MKNVSQERNNVSVSLNMAACLLYLCWMYAVTWAFYRIAHANYGANFGAYCTLLLWIPKKIF